ncbi:DUF1552 domain-containing protein [Bythopirellula goksoeyrii]|uniref:DUF1552 domain-containing protein n=1 Tax=Bythopirellula goksoeyrii TaxID=1400387 RepID=A0A5B9QGR7_9BACT|nr:DUF1552 domain-containing protein [Bythopirellula goksoeyrii]QEG37984.1 hypothetical protein Pr1d_53320 [Bythopirellula goksoeyrii]
MTHFNNRRDFLRKLGLSAAAVPFLGNTPSLGFANQGARKQRLVILFTPNGVVPKTFWPDEEGTEFTLKESLSPLEPFKDRSLILHGVCDKLRGDGDSHMRGMGCLLTGSELFPGNIQGGSDTPAGWSSGLSIDQEIKNYLQAKEATHTRFGSLEFGVLIPERADTWTRMVYAGPNRPIAPIDDPYQMFSKMYGEMKDRENIASILDDLQADLRQVRNRLSTDDQRLLDQHATFVREFEKSLQETGDHDIAHAEPELDPGVEHKQENMPTLSRMQIELMVNAFQNDFTRVATLQYTNSVGQARMSWLGIEEGHHTISHEPDDNATAQEQLTKINHWFCEQVALLVKKLAETPEPGGPGSLLDNTLIVWTNELGKGNSHTMDNIPFVLVGGGLDFSMGRSVKLKEVNHNRLLMSLAHGFGHQIETFGNPDYCGGGALSLG